MDIKSCFPKPGMMAHAFSPSTWEAEAGGSLSLRPTWSTELIPGQSEFSNETLSQKPNEIIF